MKAASEGLRVLYELARKSNSVNGLRTAVDAYLKERPPSDVELLRERAPPVKKLVDEILPMLAHLEAEIPEAKVQFNLNDKAPDCWVTMPGIGEPLGYEITVAQARERIYVGRHLNKHGWSGGFLGLPDEAPTKVFEAANKRQRVVHTPDMVLNSVRRGVLARLARKNRPHYSGMHLVIEAPMHLDRDRWDEVRTELSKVAVTSPFATVYLQNDRDDSFGFYLKA